MVCYTIASTAVEIVIEVRAWVIIFDNKNLWNITTCPRPTLLLNMLANYIIIVSLLWLQLTAVTTGEFIFSHIVCLQHGPLTRYVKLRVAHAPEMPWTFSVPPRVSDPDMHHDTRVMHAGIANKRFPLKSVAGKTLHWHSRCMRNPQFTYLVRGPWRRRSEVAILTVHLIWNASTDSRVAIMPTFSLLMPPHVVVTTNMAPLQISVFNVLVEFSLCL